MNYTYSESEWKGNSFDRYIKRKTFWGAFEKKDFFTGIKNNNNNRKGSKTLHKSEHVQAGCNLIIISYGLMQ